MISRFTLNSLQEGYIKTFASEKTAIIYRDNAEQYWRFKDADWTVKPSHIPITNFATVWKRY